MTEWLYLLLFAFTFFLLAFSVFMYFEEKKFGDNQFTMKLLPPPSPAFLRRPLPVDDTPIGSFDRPHGPMNSGIR